jgi:hypothetical protein
LDIAKSAFEDNAGHFYLSDLDKDEHIKIEILKDKYNSLIDAVEVIKKPKYSDEHLEGIQEGLEKSKVLFGEFIKEFP